ncbi:hypothetical protein Bbelb_312900 [Branchiostoma belcheri]|nr:hypothetical protein Bbelb_312900 [Branchiostoma belcheri]
MAVRVETCKATGCDVPGYRWRRARLQDVTYLATGGDVETCKATGCDVPGYRWRRARLPLDENRRTRVVYSRTHARKFQIYGHFQVCATRTLGVCGPAHGPDMNHSGVRAMYRPAHVCTRHP